MGSLYKFSLHELQISFPTPWLAFFILLMTSLEVFDFNPIYHSFVINAFLYLVNICLYL